MRFAVDGWAPDYGTSFQDVNDALAESTARVEPGVEVAATAWAPVEPSAVPLPTDVLFVDGVRRVEARLWIDSDDAGEAAPGICASYAAGVVHSTPGGARVKVELTRRGLFTVDPRATDILTSHGPWEVRHTTADPGKPVFDVLSSALQERLSDLEGICAAEARATMPATDDDLLVIDGPLRGRTALPRAIAVIKSHQMSYLPADLNRTVGALLPGQRTPVFLLGTSWDRFCWYLRLPGADSVPWAGVLRVECAADLPPEEAIRLSNVSQSVLPRYASEPFREPRAPQNLYPIAGLERHLRHRLGDPNLLRRGLQAAAHRASASATPTGASR